jgi:LysR family cys regulon transcriptional activator
MSKAAAALGATQPAVSKQIQLLEVELGVQLFVRRGNNLLSLSPVGQEIHHAAQGAWQEVDNMRTIAADSSLRRSKAFSVASTYTHARYMLIRPVKDFILRHPDIAVRLQQGAPKRIFELVAEGSADLGISTQPQQLLPELVAMPCFQTKHSLVVPVNHPLAGKRSVTLEMVAQFPIIGHDASQQIGNEIQRRFNEAGLAPNVVLQAQDSDVMKAYVEAGIGIAIIPKIAFSPLRDKNLRSKDVSHLFDATTTCVILRRGGRPPPHVLEFITLLSPQLARKDVGARILAHVEE